MASKTAKEVSDDGAASSNGYPPAYEPEIPRLRPVERFMAFFTPIAACKVALVRASRKSGPAPLRQLIASFEKLSAVQPSPPKAADLLDDAKSLIALQLIQSEELAKAEEWIRQIIREGSADRHQSLTWQLFKGYVKANNIAGGLTSAADYLTNTRRPPLRFRGAVAEAVEFIFAHTEGQGFCDILNRFPPSLAAEEWVKSVRVLSAFPDKPPSARRATQFIEEIKRETLASMPGIQCATLIAVARSFEVLGKLDRMLDSASQAARLVPGDTHAQYWLARARVQNREPVEKGPSDSPRWHRLAAMSAVLRRPDFESGGLLLLACKDKSFDTLERVLIRGLLEESVIVSPSASSEVIGKTAALAESVAYLFGESLATHRTLSLKEIVVDRRPELAFRRLEALGDPSPSVSELIAVARMLAGSPRPSHELTGLLEQLEICFYRALTSPDHRPDVALPSVESLNNHSLVQAFPALRFARSLLDSATSEYIDETSATPWMQILLLQLRLARTSPLKSLTLPKGVPQAWILDTWWSVYGPTGGNDPEAVVAGKRVVADYLGEGKGEPGRTLSRLAQARSKREVQHVTIPGGFSEPDWGLGECGTHSFAEELKFESLLFAEIARKAGASKSPREAREGWTKLENDLRRRPLGVRAMWTPIVEYHLAALQATTDLGKGISALKQLLGTASEGLAKLQLGLAMIAANDLEAAALQLNGMDANWPATVYAKALLSSRLGDLEGALELLSKERMPTSEVYAGAALRLRRSIQERRDGTRSSYDPTALSAAITNRNGALDAARALRVWADQAFRDPSNAGSVTPPELDSVLQALSLFEIPGASELTWLSRALSSPGAFDESELQDIADPVLRRACALCLIRHALADNNISKSAGLARQFWADTDVCSVLGMFDEIVVSITQLCAGSLKTTFPIEESNGWLTSAFRSHPTPDAIERLSAAIGDLRNYALRGSPELEFWAELGAVAQAVCQGESVDFSRYPSLEIVTRLVSDDPDVRQGAAKEAPDRLEQDLSNLDARQKAAVLLLASWVDHDRTRFLEAYDQMMPAQGGEPFGIDSIWLAAATIWFESGNWNELLDSDLPADIADLEDPRVRLTVGMAYARSAAQDCANNDLRSARVKVRQAQSTLEPLYTSK